MPHQKGKYKNCVKHHQKQFFKNNNDMIDFY